MSLIFFLSSGALIYILLMLLPPNLNVRLSNGPVHERVRGLGRRRKAFSGQFRCTCPNLFLQHPKNSLVRVSVCTGLCDRNGVDDVAIHPRSLRRRFVFYSALSFLRSAGGQRPNSPAYMQHSSYGMDASTWSWTNNFVHVVRCDNVHL